MSLITADNWNAADLRSFESKRSQIQAALDGDTGILDGVTEENKEDIFYMLLFCICVPQSKAVKAEEAIEILRKQNYYNIPLLEKDIISVFEKRVRFHITKAKRIIEARHKFFNSSLWENLKKFYVVYKNSSDVQRFRVLSEARRYLVENINGIGMKLSGHFLRNIGMSGLAILDVHIIDGLFKRGIFDDEMGPNKNKYLDYEQRMMSYANKLGISLDQLDLLLWSQKTGYVFK